MTNKEIEDITGDILRGLPTGGFSLKDIMEVV